MNPRSLTSSAAEYLVAKQNAGARRDVCFGTSPNPGRALIIELDWRDFVDVRFASIATKFRIAPK
jgi:hypothetical protein